MIRCDMAGCMGWGRGERAFRNGRDLCGVRGDLGWKGRLGHKIRCMRYPGFDVECLMTNTVEYGFETGNFRFLTVGNADEYIGGWKNSPGLG